MAFQRSIYLLIASGLQLLQFSSADENCRFENGISYCGQMTTCCEGGRCCFYLEFGVLIGVIVSVAAVLIAIVIGCTCCCIKARRVKVVQQNQHQATSSTVPVSDLISTVEPHPYTHQPLTKVYNAYSVGGSGIESARPLSQFSYGQFPQHRSVSEVVDGSLVAFSEARQRPQSVYGEVLDRTRTPESIYREPISVSRAATVVGTAKPPELPARNDHQGHKVDGESSSISLPRLPTQPNTTNKLRRTQSYFGRNPATIL